MDKLKQIRILDMPLNEALKKSAPYLAAAAVTALLCYFFVDPISKNESHSRRMWLAVLGAGLLFYRLLTKGKPLTDNTGSDADPLGTKIYFGTLVIAIVFGIFNYFNFNKKEVISVGDGSDMAYYYLNTKYLDELGYYRLYAAMLTADREFNNRYATKLRRYRDLRNDEIKPIKVAFEHGAEIKKKDFTKERWESFKHDVDYFLAFPEMNNLYDYMFSDHGYNPPPTWAVPGYALAGHMPVEHVKWIAMVDVLAVVGMSVAVAWAFNIEATLFVLLFFLCTFSGRWPMLGQCLLRFDWSSALVVSICLIKKEKWALAGAALAYAAMNRIFPAIFFFPWIIAALVEWMRTKKLPMHHIRFAGGAAAVTIFLIATAVFLFGTETLKESSVNLTMHNNSFSSHRVGLASVLVYDGETTKAQISAKGGMRAKEIAVQATKQLRTVFGLLTLGFIGYYILRVRRPVYELIHLAAIPLFCMTTPQINYYNLRIILVIWHIANLKEGLVHRVGILGLFAIEIVAQWSHISGNERFTTTVYTSYGLLFYYLFVMLWMVKEILDANKNVQKASQ